MPTTKLYENATGQTIVIRELGNHEVAPGDRVSVTSEFQTPINILNYPGLAEVAGLTAEEHAAALAGAREATKNNPAAGPPAPSDTPGGLPGAVSGTLTAEKQEGNKNA